MTRSTSLAAPASAAAVAAASLVSATVASAPIPGRAARRAWSRPGGGPPPAHPARTEAPGDLDGHLARVPGCAEDQDRLAGLDRNPAAQRDPRRHGRVH